MSKSRSLAGFGFGAIQGGLFLYEAHLSGCFERLVVAEVVPGVVDAVRANGGAFTVNVAMQDGIRSETIPGVEILNPAVPEDREALIQAMAESHEIATALPSVDFYEGSPDSSVVGILAQVIRRKLDSDALPPAVVYTAENNNHAAERLTELLNDQLDCDWAGVIAPLNTVIGKMSGVVTDPDQIRSQGLERVTPDSDRALLVESFNRILISRVPDGFDRGIAVFDEKDDLLPFEEAKLFGHNAVHALLGYLLRESGARYISDAASRPDLMALAREAFLEESGAALCRKYAGLDPLFTETGFTAYADDLLERMVNPHLMDTVERITRDPRRKLAWNDRLVGTMRLCLSQGVEPKRFARGAAAALNALATEDSDIAGRPYDLLWPEADASAQKPIIERIVKF